MTKPKLYDPDLAILAISDQLDAFKEGILEIESGGTPQRYGSDDYYDGLARALAARLTTDTACTRVEWLVAAIKNIEMIALLRAKSRIALP